MDIWRSFFRYFNGLSSELVFYAFIAVSQSLLILPLAWITQRLFDDLIPKGEPGIIILSGIAMIALTLGGNLLLLWSRYGTLKVTKPVFSDIRLDLLNKSFTLPRSYYSNTDINILHSSLVQNTDRLDAMVSSVLTLIAPALAVTAIAALVLFWLNIWLFLMLIIFVPPVLLIHRKIGGKVKEIVPVYQKSFERLSRGVLTTLQSMDLTRILSAEKEVLAKRRDEAEDFKDASFRISWLSTAYTLSNQTILVTANTIIFVFGGWAVATNRMTLGGLMAFFAIFSLMQRHLNTLLSRMPSILEGMEAARVLNKFLTANDELPYQGVQSIKSIEQISFENVCFSYEENSVLTNVSLKISNGERTVIQGDNGVGKSTLIYLLLGFYQPTSGNIFINGESYETTDISTLRSKVGVVMQSPQFFDGTIWENLTLGITNPDKNEIANSLRLVFGDDDFGGSGLDFDTRMGEQGVRLSGGEKQRLAIARALISKPDLLVLDEPTNHLDRKTAIQLLGNIESLSYQPALLIISHDQTFLSQFNKILTLSDASTFENQTTSGQLCY